MSRRVMVIVLLLATGLMWGGVRAQEAETADLSGIKAYLLEKADGLDESAAELAATATTYYELAAAVEFDYAALWADEAEAVSAVLAAAKAQWIVASPVYEQMEGIVAGVPSLAEYDAILDAGASAEEDPEGAPDFSITLPDGAVLEKPGNIFGLLESALWGTRAEFVAAEADLDGDGSIAFGEALPDANLLKGFADSLASYSSDLLASSEAWEPTESDAFTALVVMVPTMSEYFGSWKESRFVAGDEATSATFAVISRLADIQDILTSLQVVYAGVTPLVQTLGDEPTQQIGDGLDSLKAYVADIYEQEQGGKRFSAEEADFFGSEAQDRAMAITGQISQVAALLGIPLAE